MLKSTCIERYVCGLMGITEERRVSCATKDSPLRAPCRVPIGSGGDSTTMAPEGHPRTNQLLTEKEAAAVLRLSDATLRSWRKRAIGPRYYKVGRDAVRYRLDDLETFIRDGLVEPTEVGR